MRCNVCLAPLTVRAYRITATRQAKSGKRKVPLYHPCPRLTDPRFHPAHKDHKNEVKLWRKRNPERTKAVWMSWKLRRCYGLTPDEYKAMLKEQKYKCAICKKPFDVPTIDHDHITHKIRGILCGMCNVAIAHFRDNAEAMRRGAVYVTKGGFKYTAVKDHFIPDPEYLAKRNKGGRNGRNRSGRPIKTKDRRNAQKPQQERR